ncbi:CD99 molecule isoform X1 [Pagrus major]|uniref:CD99 molecule isoform X1 n=1 Tax=Pagrus major TaxID=143350 RepID=UPI003CC896AA
MKVCLRILLFLFLLTGTLTQDFDLGDALDELVPPTPAKPKDPPKAPEKPKTDGGFGLDLGDALGPDPTPKPDKPTVKPPKSRDGGGGGFDLEDAFGPDPATPKPDKPAVKPPISGGGGSFDDSDLFDIGGGGEYKPDPGRPGGNPSGGGGDPGYDPNGGADQPQEAGSGQIAGIASAIGVALLGAASSYFAYQKKKLCFKLQGGQDPEMGKRNHGNQSDPQVFSNLLRTS